MTDDYDIETGLVDDDLETQTLVENYDITTVPLDNNLETLFSLMKAGIIKIPTFQRNYVWDIKRASKLIESLYLGLPVPQVFLYEKERNSYYVIDGQQRLLSIFFFLAGKFPTKNGRTKLRECFEELGDVDSSFYNNKDYFTPFKLKFQRVCDEKNNPLTGRTIDDLEKEQAQKFKFMRPLRAMVIRQNSPEDDSAMYEVFNRLNTGGQNLTSQEIRMSLYQSPFMEELGKMNKELGWRELLGKSEADIHLRDIEILLRAFAMLENGDNYTPSMTVFLNTYSKKATKFSAEEVAEKKKTFEQFLSLCKHLPEKAFFNNKNHFVVSWFEAVFVAACKVTKGQFTAELAIDPNSWRELHDDKDFSDACNGDGMGSSEKVKSRLKRALELLRLI